MEAFGQVYDVTKDVASRYITVKTGKPQRPLTGRETRQRDRAHERAQAKKARRLNRAANLPNGTIVNMLTYAASKVRRGDLALITERYSA